MDRLGSPQEQVVFENLEDRNRLNRLFWRVILPMVKEDNLQTAEFSPDASRQLKRNRHPSARPPGA